MDADRFICTQIDLGSTDSRERFFQSGERDAHRLLAACSTYLRGKSRALDLGCGVGRLALPMACHFAELVAVDISPTMLDGLARSCEARGVGNVQGMLSGDRWEQHAPFDLVYSVLVFQHIEEWSAIATYLARARSALAPHGVCYFQFDTRPATLGYRVRNAMPDAVLPKSSWRRGIRRIRRPAATVREGLRTAGLRVIAELHGNSEHHAFILSSSS